MLTFKDDKGNIVRVGDTVMRIVPGDRWVIEGDIYVVSGIAEGGNVISLKGVKPDFLYIASYFIKVGITRNHLPKWF